MQTQLKAIVSPFKGLRIEEFMKIHGSMPDQVQIRSFLTVAGANPAALQEPLQSSTQGKLRGLSDLTMTPQPSRYSTVKQPQNTSLTAQGFDREEQKGGCSPPMTKEIRDILDDLQNNQLQIYALWSEEGDVHRSFIQ